MDEPVRKLGLQETPGQTAVTRDDHPTRRTRVVGWSRRTWGREHGMLQTEDVQGHGESDEVGRAKIGGSQRKAAAIGGRRPACKAAPQCPRQPCNGAWSPHGLARAHSRRPTDEMGRDPLLVEATRSTSESLLRPLALVLPLTEILYLFNAQVGELGIAQQRLLA